MKSFPVLNPRISSPKFAIRIKIDEQSVVRMALEYKFIHDLLASGKQLPKCAWRRAEEYDLIQIERGADGYAIRYDLNPRKVRAAAEVDGKVT